MATRKYHWAIPVSDPSNYPHAWRAYAGGYFVQACGRKKKSAVGYPAERFAAKAQRNSDWYCTDCAKAARLALAAESAPKPSDVVWPKPRPISEAPTDGSCVLGPRADSERYAELRKLVEAWQTAYRQNDKAQTKNNPITEVWLKHWLNFCDAQKPLLDWSHR